MKWNRGHGGTGKSASTSRGGRDPEDVEQGALDCSMEELQEFLEADLIDVPVNLEFKESLRRKLWDLVQVRNRLRRRNPDGH